MVDVSFSIIECDNGPKIFLELMNEYHSSQSTSFKLRLYDQSTKKTQEIEISNYYLKLGAFCHPTCDQDQFTDLIFDVKEGMNPMYITGEVEFH